MTDELRSVPGEDTYETGRPGERPATEINRDADATPPDSGDAQPPEEANPWLKEGADAPDAADIEDPAEQL